MKLYLFGFYVCLSFILPLSSHAYSLTYDGTAVHLTGLSTTTYSFGEYSLVDNANGIGWLWGRHTNQGDRYYADFDGANFNWVPYTYPRDVGIYQIVIWACPTQTSPNCKFNDMISLTPEQALASPYTIGGFVTVSLDGSEYQWAMKNF